MSGPNNNPNKFHPYNHPRQPPPPRGLSSPSPIMFRPPSPWAPSPPILTNARPRFERAPSQSPLTVSNASPRPFGATVPDQRGTRGPSIQQPRPRWPVHPQQQQQPQGMNGSQAFHSAPPVPPIPSQFQPATPTVVYQSPQRPMTPSYDENYNMRPQPYRPPSVNANPAAPAQLMRPQTPHEMQYMRPPQESPVHLLTYQQSSFGLPSPIPREFETYAYAECPPEPPLPKSYVIYDDEEEEGPSTAEIIANQSQDYVDEKLAQYQITIAQLQGECEETK